MKQKGFTLIELLSIIVILAIIILICVPIVLNVIEKSKLGSLKASAHGLVDAAEMYIANNLKDGIDVTEFIIEDNKQIGSNKLNYKGNIVNGYVTISSEGKIMICMNNETNYAFKNFDDKEFRIDKGVCTGEKDPETLEYLTTNSYNYGELRVNIKILSSHSNLSTNPRINEISIISDTNNDNKYYISPTEPTEPVENMIWIKQNAFSSNFVSSEYSNIQLGFCYQYVNNNWDLKDAYIFDGTNWNLFSSVTPWKQFALLSGVDIDGINSFNELISDENLMNLILNNQISMNYLISIPELITEIKNSSNYSEVLVPLILDSSAITNKTKYENNLPFYIVNEGIDYYDFTYARGCEARLTSYVPTVGYSVTSTGYNISSAAPCNCCGNISFGPNTKIDITNYSRIGVYINSMSRTYSSTSLIFGIYPTLVHNGTSYSTSITGAGQYYSGDFSEATGQYYPTFRIYSCSNENNGPTGTTLSSSIKKWWIE